jgi:hypothetical protein
MKTWQLKKGIRGSTSRGGRLISVVIGPDIESFSSLHKFVGARVCDPQQLGLEPNLRHDRCVRCFRRAAAHRAALQSFRVRHAAPICSFNCSS